MLHINETPPVYLCKRCYVAFQAQLVVLSAQVVWSENCDNALQQIEKAGNSDMAPMENVLKIVEATLNVLADSVLQEQPPVRRRKLEHLVSSVICTQAAVT